MGSWSRSLELNHQNQQGVWIFVEKTLKTLETWRRLNIISFNLAGQMNSSVCPEFLLCIHCHTGNTEDTCVSVTLKQSCATLAEAGAHCRPLKLLHWGALLCEMRVTPSWLFHAVYFFFAVRAKSHKTVCKIEIL